MFSKFFLNLQQYSLSLSLHGKNHTKVFLSAFSGWKSCLRFVCSSSWSCIGASGSSIPTVVIPVWLRSNLNKSWVKKKSLAHLKVPTTDRGKWNVSVSPGFHCVAQDGLSLTNHTRMLPVLGMQAYSPISSWGGFSWILNESVGKVSHQGKDGLRYHIVGCREDISKGTGEKV